MTTGERIKTRRKDLGITADQLAEQIGVSRATIFRYENGDIEKLPVNALVPIANVLHTSVNYLMGWDDDSEKRPATVSDDGPNAVKSRIIALLDTMTEDQLEKLLAVIDMIHKPQE